MRLRGSILIRYCRYAKVAELVDALASGVSVLTDVGVQVPPLAPSTTRYCFQQRPAKVAELVDALASGVSVLTNVGVQVPPLAPTAANNILNCKKVGRAKVAELVDALASGVSVLTDVGGSSPPPRTTFFLSRRSTSCSCLSDHTHLSVNIPRLSASSAIPLANAIHDGSSMKWRSLR
jgi:hypothetical protein